MASLHPLGSNLDYTAELSGLETPPTKDYLLSGLKTPPTGRAFSLPIIYIRTPELVQDRHEKLNTLVLQALLSYQHLSGCGEIARG